MGVLRDWQEALLPFWRKSVFSLLPTGVQPGRPVYPSTDVRNLLGQYKRSEIVYACIQRRAASAIGPHLRAEYRANPKAEWTEKPGDPVRRLLMRPNKTMDEASFFKALIVSLDISGLFYAEIERGPLKLPIGLHPLNPAQVAPVPDAEGTIVSYEWKDGNKKVTIPAADMLVKREYDPASRFQGLSRLAVCLGTVDADTAQTDYVRAFFNNGGQPSGILKLKGRKLTGTRGQEEAESIKAQWRAKYGRQWGRQHDIAVLDEDADYQRLGANLNELNSETMQAITESRICMTFDIPPLIIYAWVGLLRSTYSNLKEAWRGFWDASLMPLYSELATWLTWELLPEFVNEELIYSELVRLRWDMAGVKWFAEDLDAQQARARENLRAGGITVNEFRAAVGEQPDAAGDYYLRGLAVVAVPAGSDPNADMAPLLGKRHPAPLAVKGLRDATTRGIERQAQVATRKYLARQYRQAAARVMAQGKSSPLYGTVWQVKAADPTDGLDDGDEIAELMQTYHISLLDTATGDAGTVLGVDLSFELSNPAVQRVLGKLAKKVRGVADTTRDEIRALVGRQADEGWSVDDLAQHIAGLAETSAPTRAMLIARTETATAYSQGSLLAYQESNVVAGTEWLVSDPCPICAALEGKTADLGEEFDDGIDAPPAHPACKCAVAPVLKG